MELRVGNIGEYRKMQKIKWKIIAFLLGVTAAAAIAVSVFFSLRITSERGVRVAVRDQIFSVEVADTLEKRTLGLGERDALCQRCGMLFVFPEPIQSSFWMKGMRFPIDIIWFNSMDGRIVHIEQNISADAQSIFTTPESADRVLEINAGQVDQFGIREGERVQTLL